MLGSGGVIVYIIYRFITYLNNEVVNQTDLEQDEINLRLYWIGMINGALNFILALTYDSVAELLVKWENHPYSDLFSADYVDTRTTELTR